MEEPTKESSVGEEGMPLMYPRLKELGRDVFEQFGIRARVGGVEYPLTIRASEPGTAIEDLSASWLSANLPTSQIRSIMDLAVSVFEDEQIAKDWLNGPNLATDDKPPIALLGTEEGFLRVQSLLGRIEYGVLA